MIALDFEVKTYDVDFAGVVSNLVYLRWLEDMRMALLGSVIPLGDLVSRQLFPTLVQTTINYRAPLRLPDHAQGVMRLVSVGTTSVTLEATFTSRRTGLVVADARQVGLILDGQSGKPIPVPAELRGLLAE